MLALCRPLTTKIKSYPFEVLTKSEGSVVLADHVKSLDRKARKVILKTGVPEGVLSEVRGKATGANQGIRA